MCGYQCQSPILDPVSVVSRFFESLSSPDVTHAVPSAVTAATLQGKIDTHELIFMQNLAQHNSRYTYLGMLSLSCRAGFVATDKEYIEGWKTYYQKVHEMDGRRGRYSPIVDGLNGMGFYGVIACIFFFRLASFLCKRDVMILFTMRDTGDDAKRGLRDFLYNDNTWSYFFPEGTTSDKFVHDSRRRRDTH